MEVVIGILIILAVIGFFWMRKVRRDKAAHEAKRAADARAEERRSSETRSSARESERIFTQQRAAPKPAPAKASPERYWGSPANTSAQPDTTSNLFLAQAVIASDASSNSRSGHNCDSRGASEPSNAPSASSYGGGDSGGGGGGGGDGGSCSSGE